MMQPDLFTNPSPSKPGCSGHPAHGLSGSRRKLHGSDGDLQTPRSVSAKDLRDAALAQVESNNQSWADLAFLQFEQLFFANRISNQSNLFTGETIRHWLEPHIGKPGHHNAWGALTMRFVRAGLIKKTGRYVPMQDAKSHGRATAEYGWV